jgi:hypothetical protein
LGTDQDSKSCSYNDWETRQRGREQTHTKSLQYVQEVLQGKYYKGSKVYAVGDVDTDRHYILFAAASAAIAAIPI